MCSAFSWYCNITALLLTHSVYSPVSIVPLLASLNTGTKRRTISLLDIMTGSALVDATCNSNSSFDRQYPIFYKIEFNTISLEDADTVPWVIANEPVIGIDLESIKPGLDSLYPLIHLS
jgi:hypothetical protein